MPNRIIKESIWTSPNLNKISPLAQFHFFRLLPVPDDHGCFESTPDVVKGKIYPKMREVTEEQIRSWQDELEEKNILARWTDGEREFAIFITFSKHQRIRSLHQRKTPVPPESIANRCKQLNPSDDNCQQVTASDRLNPNPNPNPIPIPNHKPYPTPYQNPSFIPRDRVWG